MEWGGRGAGLVVRGENEYGKGRWETEFGAGAGMNGDLVGGRVRRVRRRKRSWSGGRDGLGSRCGAGGMGFDGDGEISVIDSSDVDGRQERDLSWMERDRILPTSWQE